MKKIINKDMVFDYIIITIGAFMSSLAIIVFIKPMQIPLSGITGIAVVINYLTGFPAGVINAVLNIPLVIIGYKSFGRVLMFRTMYTVLATSVFLDVLPNFLVVYKGDILISLFFGGVIGGIGGGLVFLRGSTGGGLDIISKLLTRRSTMPMGTMIMIMNAFIIAFSAFIYGNVESALYAVILTYVSSNVVNSILTGTDVSNGAFIVTGKPEEMSKAIIKELHRGVTALSATGMYTHSEKTVLMCAVRRHETILLKRLIAETDPDSFMLLSNVQEVLGRGFKQYESDLGKHH
ncbi:MAG: YitT family protein [Bacillota bacterium]|nr:YitT family protein [Bacillota bacterium]